MLYFVIISFNPTKCENSVTNSCIFSSALCRLPGVGAKVADCVCLMSLDKTEAIPVDTHVWQISLRDYDIPELKKTKSLTDKAYKTIGKSVLKGSLK